MGVRLVKKDIEYYELKSKTGSRQLLRNKDYHDLNEFDEKYCLATGYFLYVPTEGKVIPRDIRIADKNIEQRLAGIIDGKGRIIKKKTEEETVEKAPEKTVLNIDIDEETGEPIFIKPGTSSLDADVPKELAAIVPPKPKSGKFGK